MGEPHQAVVVLGLQVSAAHHVDPDQTLLRSALRQLSELAWRSSHPGVLVQWVHPEGALGHEPDNRSFMGAGCFI